MNEVESSITSANTIYKRKSSSLVTDTFFIFLYQTSKRVTDATIFKENSALGTFASTIFLNKSQTCITFTSTIYQDESSLGVTDAVTRVAYITS